MDMTPPESSDPTGSAVVREQIDRLKTAVRDARALVDFAVTHNLKLEDRIIDDLMKRIEELGDLTTATSVSEAKEGEFWKAYHKLTQATAPVTAASIGASERVAASRWWRPGPTGGYSLAAALLFVILAVLQIMWVIGTTLRNDLEKADKAIAEQEEKRRPLDQQLRLLAVAVQRESEGDQTTKPARPPAPSKAVRDLEDKRLDYQLQLEVVDQALNTLKIQREPVVDLIDGWSMNVTLKQWRLDTPERLNAAKAKLKSVETEMAAKKVTEKSPLAVVGRLFGSRVSLPTEELREARQEVDRARDQRVVELKLRSDLILDVLQRYVFPVLLGLLGALTYILRSLIVQIRESSYTATFFSLSLVRLSLGMMAGLLGGMIIPQGDSVLKNLPPLTLPFLLGFAVEVLFAFLDRIVKTFVDDRPAAKA